MEFDGKNFNYKFSQASTKDSIAVSRKNYRLMK